MMMLKQSNLISKAVPKLKAALIRNPPRLLPPHIRDALPPPRKNLKASILVPILHITNINMSDSDNDDNANTHTSTSSSSTRTRTRTCVPSSISILFTKRSSRLKDHPSQISFPGGHVDDELDHGSDIRAAIRETREELLPEKKDKDKDKDNDNNGQDDDDGTSTYTYNFKEGLEVVGQTESIPSIKNAPVTPIIACFRDEFTSKDQIQSLFPGNVNEVEQVFTLTLEELLSMEEEEPLKRLGPMMGPVYKSQYGKIWGLTAMVLKPILHDILVPIFLKEEGNKEENKGKEEEEEDVVNERHRCTSRL